MPLGWYYAQGLVPLGYDSSDDDDSPCQLPNGRMVCGLHGLVVCGKCCVDFSFMDEDDDEEEEGAEDEGDDGNDEGDEEDGPRKLPDGRIVCGPHGLVVCGKCCLDFSFMDEDDDEEEEEVEDEGPPNKDRDEYNSGGIFGKARRRGSGRAFPTKFIPPTDSTLPTDLFPGRAGYTIQPRYVHRDNRKQVLIFTDGACLNNGQPNPKAGWGFVYGPGCAGKPSVSSGRLEHRGPFGDHGVQSSNRAELRAVIAALRFRHWVGEGFTSMVIATDSAYVVEGSTRWARTWIKNGWKTSRDADVKNKDLWEMLLGEVERWEERGMSIQLWKIPRSWNHTADAVAALAAEEKEAQDEWVDILGVCV